jgi:hypothetical protein
MRHQEGSGPLAQNHRGHTDCPLAVGWQGHPCRQTWRALSERHLCGRVVGDTGRHAFRDRRQGRLSTPQGYGAGSFLRPAQGARDTRGFSPRPRIHLVGPTHCGPIPTWKLTL